MHIRLTGRILSKLRDHLRFVCENSHIPDGGYYAHLMLIRRGRGNILCLDPGRGRNLLESAPAKNMRFPFGINTDGNWEHGKNVIHVEHSLKKCAQFGKFKRKWKRDYYRFLSKFSSDARSKRIRPHLEMTKCLHHGWINDRCNGTLR